MAGEFDVDGLENVIANLQTLGRDVPKEAGGALYEIMHETLAKSDEIVPLDKGPLKNSKFVKKPETSGDEVSVTGGYGGQTIDYAVEQHENLTYRHSEGRSAKYVEKPLVETKANFAPRVARKLKARLGLK